MRSPPFCGLQVGRLQVERFVRGVVVGHTDVWLLFLVVEVLIPTVGVRSVVVAACGGRGWNDASTWCGSGVWVRRDLFSPFAARGRAGDSGSGRTPGVAPPSTGQRVPAAARMGRGVEQPLVETYRSGMRIAAVRATRVSGRCLCSGRASASLLVERGCTRWCVRLSPGRMGAGSRST